MLNVMLAALASPLLTSSVASFAPLLPSFASESYCSRGKVADGNPGMGAVNPVEGKTDPIEAKTWEKGATSMSRKRRVPILCKNDRTQPTASSFIGQCHHSLGETVSFLVGRGRRAGLRLARYSHMDSFQSLTPKLLHCRAAAARSYLTTDCVRRDTIQFNQFCSGAKIRFFASGI